MCTTPVARPRSPDSTGLKACQPQSTRWTSNYVFEHYRLEQGLLIVLRLTRKVNCELRVLPPEATGLLSMFPETHPCSQRKTYIYIYIYIYIPRHSMYGIYAYIGVVLGVQCRYICHTWSVWGIYIYIYTYPTPRLTVTVRPWYDTMGSMEEAAGPFPQRPEPNLLAPV